MLHDMLEAIQAKGGQIKPTHLLYKANLSHDALKRYVQELTDGGLVEFRETKRGKVYALTDKGYDFLSQYKQFREFSESFGI